MKNPVVSIIIPAYNYGKYIEDCVKSCFMQDYDPLQVIVVDDASTDRSREVLEHMMTRYNDLEVYFAKENGGYSMAKNAGISKAKGELIVHLDADDMLTPNSIECRVQAFRDDPELEFVHANAYRVYDDVDYTKCLRKQQIHRLKKDDRAFIHAQTYMVRRSVYDRYGVYYEGLRSKADKEILWRWRVCKGQTEPLIKSKKIKDVVAFYRKHGKNMIRYREKHPKYNKKITEIFKERQKVYEKEGITKENTPFLRS